MQRENVIASIRLVASKGPLVAPDRFQIWRAGANPGDYGDLYFTPRAAQAVMSEYVLRGNALVMDFEHALNPRVNPELNPSDPPPTAGYLALEIVDGSEGPELWGVPRWSDCGRSAPVPDEVCCGKHQVESGMRCYVSPDWDIDTTTREPLRLNRVSLVAEPATWAINMLASRASVGSPTAGAPMDEMEKMRAGYAAAKAMMGSGDPKTAKAASTLCAAYEEAASTLGIALDPGDEGKGEGAAAADGAQTTNQVDPKQAAAGETQTPEEKKVDAIDDNGRGNGPGPAVAKIAASRGAVANGDKAITVGELERVLALREERQALRAGIADRVPKGHENLVASMPLGQLREYARGLPPKAATAGGDGGGAVTAGKGTSAKPADKLTPREEFMVERWGKALGVKPENVTASRKVWEADPYEGAIAVDIFALTKQMREKSRAGRAAA